MDERGRILAQAFTTRCIRDLASKNNPLPLGRLAPLIDLAEPDATLAQAFDGAYRVLTQDYRCEYVYANTLTITLSTDPTASNAISGLRIFMSIADLVIVDHQVSAYEVKTDLDSFARLELQLHSYGTCCEFVHLVTSPAKTARALAEAPPHVGVVSLDEAGAVDTVRGATGGLDRINCSTLFRVLRKDEHLAILGRQVGYTVDVQPARLWQRLNELFMQLPVDVAYSEFSTELRRRDLEKRLAALDAGLPESLRAAATGLALSRAAWRRLGALLTRPAATFRV
ncbi:sce7726 family protein [Mycolicibacterium llatzerense]|uniref:sce7726 family protein n=1 Tax=Mycolicibacterium llatzerense TaxID=280871 RepID=UPI0008DE3956|nr:sce7726 family protein [Mycolicibacterium llatzerense]